MNHEEAMSKTDKALEKLYEPLYARRRDRKPVPPSIMEHFGQTSARLMSLLRTDRENDARRYYQQRKNEIDSMFKDFDAQEN